MGQVTVNTDNLFIDLENAIHLLDTMIAEQEMETDEEEPSKKMVVTRANISISILRDYVEKSIVDDLREKYTKEDE